MPNRQFGTPHVLTGSTARPMRRASFSDEGIGESFYQELLFQHPLLLPVDDIEPLFAPLLPLAREVRTPAGPIDILYVSPEGYLTLVETKLWRNPDSRRSVVAQIIDYATAMSKWTYEELRDAVKRSGGEDPLVVAARVQADLDEARFIDTVSRNLSKGRFLLLIVGDGIQEGVEHLADTMSRSPNLGFSLALVELALFRPSDAEQPLFVQPRILARTREVVRAVVEVTSPSRLEDIKILPAPSQSSPDGARLRLTDQVVLEKIAQSTNPRTADAFRGFLEEAGRLGIEPEGRAASLSLLWHEPESGRRFTFGSVFAEGARVSLRFVLLDFAKAGLDDAIGRRYVRAVASLVSGATVQENDTKEGKSLPRVMVGNREVTLVDLLPRATDWLKALETAVAETQAAAAAIKGP